MRIRVERGDALVKLMTSGQVGGVIVNRSGYDVNLFISLGTTGYVEVLLDYNAARSLAAVLISILQEMRRDREKEKQQVAANLPEGLRWLLGGEGDE